MSQSGMTAGTTTWSHTGYAQRIHFGLDAVDRLNEVVREVGGRRALLVTTEGRLASDAGKRVVDRLGRALASLFSGVRSHVPTSAVQAAVEQAQSDGVDCVVSFGGGSCADLGKAVCYFVEQQAGTPGASYVDRPALPHVSIPTTYSGAELTPFFGMTDEAARAKSGGGGPTITPIAAIYDPTLTLDTPVRVSAETGMNALAHGVECAYSPRRTPEAEAIALACIERVARTLPLVVAEPGDLTARVAMLEGAVLGGRCLQNASMGVHHGLAQLVGGRTGIPHGLANGLILSSAVAFNADAVPYEMAAIARALGGDDAVDAAAAAAIDRLRAAIGLPAGLRECGVTEDDLDAVARLSQGNFSVQSNPRPVSEEDARRILAAAF
ncbi:MAG: maleylacetate reductase [Actinomycetota bacterium]|jgi:alcohol dehydrogenase class IV|nr:maleylacetate reductase [Actinomycetota bacterium]